MNLVEKLMAVDKGEFEKIGEKKLVSKQLSALLGENTEIRIRALSGDEFMALSTSIVDKEGNTDYSRAFDLNAKVVAAGTLEPDLKNKDLLEHLGVATPADAAKKLFRGEINRLADEVALLSGFEKDSKTNAEVKN